MGWFALVAQLAGACGLILHRTRHTTTLFDSLEQQVPAAAQVLKFDGRGFLPAKTSHFASDSAAPPDADASATIEVQAPLVASRPFTVGARALKRSVDVTLLGASTVSGQLDQGRLAYAQALPGTDVVATRDPGHFELAFVVHDTEHPDPLRLQLDPPEGSKLQIEPGSGALLVRSESGRGILRISPPAAFDANGAQRSGEYRIEGNVVSLHVPLGGLEAPVLIDPFFAIPYWTILSDVRAPGAAVYDAQRNSTETKTTYDPVAGAVLLTRPSRSQQLEDSRLPFGQPTAAQWYQLEAPVVRTPGVDAPIGAPQAGAAEKRDWWTTFWSESETFHWQAGKWVRSYAAGLPGQIDGGLAVDPNSHHVVSVAGLASDFACSQEPYLLWQVRADDSSCAAFQTDTDTYEYEGDKWTPKKLASPPSPRVRGAVGNFKDKVMLFGGRAAAVAPTYAPSPQYGPPFPDNVTLQLLSDTWVYDQKSWQRLGTSNAPPPRESGQLIYDERRQRTVLVGGVNGSGVDAFDLWEFDGTDWISRIAAGSSTLPVSLRGRTGMLAVWNPVRQTTLLFGGLATKLESCTVSDGDIRAQSSFPERKQALTELGCFGGYVHDFWEWDGQALRQLNGVAYGGMVGDLPVFRQLSGSALTGGWGPPPSAPNTPALSSGASVLWPWRYDARPEHFKLRTELERAHLHDPSYSATVATSQPLTTATNAPAPQPAASIISPLFGSRARPQMVFDTARGKLVIVTPQDGSVFETDGASWADATPQSSPFARGANDFFAATWDSAAQEAILFDPQTALTWRYSDQSGWRRVTLGASPPVWHVDPNIRSEHDTDRAHDPMSSADKLAAAAHAQPQMTFDRARAKAVMVYEGQLWELEATGWVAKSPMPDCAAATQIIYDGARQRTIVVGCTVPATTREWNGSGWSGPFPTPLPPVYRANGVNSWQGSLQTSWVHPNAIAETPLLGGVSMMDADGVLQTWNGTVWKAGPKRSQGRQCYLAPALDLREDGFPSNGLINTYNGAEAYTDFVPTCLYPPLVEDFARDRLVMFQYGVGETEELRFEDPTPSWKQIKFTKMNWYSFKFLQEGYYPTQSVYPHPAELFSPEHVYLHTLSDPSQQMFGPPSNRVARHPQDDPLTREGLINNLYWPFLILPDHGTGRIRILTHRGVVWDMGAEMRQGLGEACTGDVDCVNGYCEASTKSPTGKICCDIPCRGVCTTCDDTPGVCTVYPRGKPDPRGCPGQNFCGEFCSGEWDQLHGGSYCSYVHDGEACGGGSVSCQDGKLSGSGICGLPGHQQPPTCLTSSGPIACPGGLSCLNATSCKPGCTSSADCANPNDICSPDGKTCISDGKVCHSNGDCPKFNACASDGMSCKPDAVLVAATALGVQPSTWTPKMVRTPQQLADWLVSQGYPKDDQGRVLLVNKAIGVFWPVFDPNEKSPITQFGRCIDRIDACRHATGTLDECVAATPRCVTDTPWADDPGGFDCCPTACLTSYFGLRGAHSGPDAMVELADGDCYPQLKADLETP